MKYYSVYIIKLSNGDYYTGRTDNFSRRLKEHIRGEVKSTRNYLPCKLVCVLSFKNNNKSYKFERYLKTGSGIAFRNKHLI